MSNSSNTSEPRPFSLRPQDFGAPPRATEPKASDAKQAAGEDGEEASVSNQDEAAPSVGRARTQFRTPPPMPNKDKEEEQKEDHTILMAVPPPAQENKGE